MIPRRSIGPDQRVAGEFGKRDACGRTALERRFAVLQILKPDPLAHPAVDSDRKEVTRQGLSPTYLAGEEGLFKRTPGNIAFVGDEDTRRTVHAGCDKIPRPPFDKSPFLNDLKVLRAKMFAHNRKSRVDFCHFVVRNRRTPSTRHGTTRTLARIHVALKMQAGNGRVNRYVVNLTHGRASAVNQYNQFSPKKATH